MKLLLIGADRFWGCPEKPETKKTLHRGKAFLSFFSID